MQRHRHPLSMVFCALVVAACSAAPSGSPTPGDEPIDDGWSDEASDERTGATLNPVLEGRAPKRLTVDQLRRVVPELTDGHTWHLDSPFAGSSFLIPMFDLMGPTLGEADYVTTSVNFLDPIPSFMKYVDEMAAQVCANTLLEPGNTALVPFPDDVDRNLRFLRLKFHGIYVPEDTVEGITELRTLYDGLFERYGEHPNPAYHVVPWLGVCLAVMTDPEFYIY